MDYLSALGVNLSDLIKEIERPSPKPNQARQLLQLAFASGIELFYAPDQTAWASIPVGGHWENWPVRKLRPWLSQMFYAQYGKPPGNQALQDAIQILEAKALFEGPCYAAYIRIAEYNGKFYLDLCNDSWQAVEVSPSGWRIVDRPPVKFRRVKGMLPLPVPQRGGSLDLLRDFVNVDDGSQWVLLVSWLLAAFRPTGPYPVLLLQGEQGCAKSTTARVLKSLIDPNISHLRTSPKEERDLLIAATNGWALAFDNLSGIPDWLSDAFCRLSTGGGFATRQLYSDDEEVIFEAQRPIVLNGIDDLAWRHDLLDRAIVLNLPVIPESKRKPEAEFWQEFEEMRPYILGAILDVVAAGLRNLPNTKLDRLPRMADFALWVTACEEALPWPAGSFITAYTNNREEQVNIAIENDPVAQAIERLLENCRGQWSGTASQLLERLETFIDEKVQKTRAWPTTPKALSGKLRRCSTFLRQGGINVEFIRTGQARLIYIRYSDANSDANDAWKILASHSEVPKIQACDANDANDANFFLESSRKEKKERVGNFASQASLPSHQRNDEGFSSDAKKVVASQENVLRHKEQSNLWDTLLSVVSNKELGGLLEYARACGAEIVWQSEKFKYFLDAKKALGPDYPSWLESISPYREELENILRALPKPRPSLTQYFMPQTVDWEVDVKNG